MKAVRLQAYGDVDQFRLETVPDPTPGPGEVLIEIAVSGLNPVDPFIRQGYLAQYMPLELPAVLGRDAAGTVAAVGQGVEGFAVGDRVTAYLPHGNGGHAGLAVAPVDSVARLGANVSFETGATLPLAGLTGRLAVAALEAKPGDRVLVSGALGAVGRAAVQYLIELGAIPVAGVRAERLAEGKALAGEALDIGIIPAAPDYDLVVSAAGPAALNALRHVRPGGKLASTVQPPEGESLEHITYLAIMNRPDAIQLQGLADAAGRGDLVLPIAERFPLVDLALAHAALAANPRGKIVILN